MSDLENKIKSHFKLEKINGEDYVRLEDIKKVIKGLASGKRLVDLTQAVIFNKPEKIETIFIEVLSDEKTP